MTPSQPSITCICGKQDCAIPYGLCHCGCGEKTGIGKHTERQRYVVEGQPRRFVVGHHRRSKDAKVNPQSRRFRKLKSLGICIVCGSRPVMGTILCEECRVKDRAKRKEKWAQRPKKPKKEKKPVVPRIRVYPPKGIKFCAICGKQTFNARRTYCEDHRVGKCSQCGIEFPKVFQRTVFCSPKCRTNSRIGLYGELAGNWQGGKVAEKLAIRGRIEYRQWRDAVFRRDNWTCQDCGARSGNGKRVDLNAHHIKEFAKYPDLRFELNNGVTLCEPCHYERHRGGEKDRKRKRRLLMSYMDFVLQPQEEGRKTEKWKVISAMGSHELGVVSFHPAWRKYVFWPERNTIFDPACLRELADFVERQTNQWKTKRGK